MSVVAGNRMERSVVDFVRACEAHIEVEQERADPDTALIDLLCDAVRFTRDQCGRVDIEPGRPKWVIVLRDGFLRTNGIGNIADAHGPHTSSSLCDETIEFESETAAFAHRDTLDEADRNMAMVILRPRLEQAASLKAQSLARLDPLIEAEQKAAENVSKEIHDADAPTS